MGGGKNPLKISTPLPLRKTSNDTIFSQIHLDGQTFQETYPGSEKKSFI